MQATVERLDRLEAALIELVPAWTMAPVVSAFQAMRGVQFMTAVTMVAEAGDLRRFDHPRQLMAFLGLVPSERSTGEARHQGGITKTGNSSARKVLVEAAWTYRHSAGLGVDHQRRQKDLPESVRDIAWKAQTRLCARFRRLLAKGKRNTIVVVAIAREIAAFLWAIARQVEPHSLPGAAHNQEARGSPSKIEERNITGCRARLGTGPRWGTPEQRLEASFALMPVVRQGPAPDENRTGGSQPAHQSMSTDVQQARLLPCTTLSTSGTAVDREGKLCLST